MALYVLQSVLAEPELRQKRKEIQEAYNQACIASRLADAQRRAITRRFKAIGFPSDETETRIWAKHRELCDEYEAMVNRFCQARGYADRADCADKTLPKEVFHRNCPSCDIHLPQPHNHRRDCPTKTWKPWLETVRPGIEVAL